MGRGGEDRRPATPNVGHMPHPDSATFRKVLGHWPTGVTVITAAPGGEPVGLTIGSFTSVSLDPPLVGFLPTKASGTWGEVARSGAFCVNVLAADQTELCWGFARETRNFIGHGWRASPLGSPILDGVVAWIDCSIDQVLDAGDHYFVMGLVHDLSVERQDVAPMLFFQGKLGRFAPE